MEMDAAWLAPCARAAAGFRRPTAALSGDVGEGGCVGDPVKEGMGIPYVVDGLSELGRGLEEEEVVLNV